ncbi:MAG: hypothetical protein KF893_23865 [Caldilineaceae bacterium]|nr:hypothetical protein [Caldilineaceae bacterium]
MTTGETIKWFAELDRSALPVAGGKGANLGEMIQSGLPVPPGFVITTQAYDSFVEQNGLRARIIDLAAQIQPETPTAVEEISTQIRSLFGHSHMPDEIATTITDAYAALASAQGPAVAVRSSATAEDLPTASFAGQQESFLNVREADALLEAVKGCWASLWTARALAYRSRQGIEPGSVSMAVVVQTMVAAEVSGILFTANPATGARDEVIVEASYGLGEAIVSGAVTPDSYRLDWESRAIKESQLGDKRVMVVAHTAGKTHTQPVPETLRGGAALSPAQLGDLAELGIRVEERFGSVPQDIEWAIADGKLWLLQARPITNLPPAPLQDVRWEPPRPGTVWMRRQVVEHMPEPLSPLFDELYLEEGLGRSIDEMIDFMSQVAGVKFDMWEFIEPPFATTVNGYAYSIASFEFRLEFMPKLLYMYIVALPRLIRHMLPYWREEALPVYLSIIERWKKVEPTNAADEDLLEGIRTLAVADAVYWFAAAVPLGMARITDVLLDSFLRSDVAGKLGASAASPTSGSYLRGFPSKTLQAQAQLEAIARQIRRSAPLFEQINAAPVTQWLDVLAAHPEGQPALASIKEYLDLYGHQIYNLDFVEPTQAEAPLPVLLALKAALAHPDQDARVHQAQLAQEREALIGRTAEVLSPLDRWFFRLFLRWAQQASPYREEALFYVGAAWPTLRRLALEVGRRLTEIGSLDTPDHVFFLRTEELRKASALRVEGSAAHHWASLARQRRELREARKRLHPPLSIPPNAELKFGPFRLKWFEPVAQEVEDGPTLDGFAVSPGQVTAPASVIRSPADFDKMKPDTILVCPTTTPAWTPLFSQARGLVTDIGGALAHGSIVAREYGIPAVMGTGVATQRIGDGEQILVNGDAGTVTLINRVDASAEKPPTAEGSAQKPAKRSTRKLAVLILALGAAVGLLLWWKRRQGPNP